jgi:hypothetical protein
MRRLGNSFILVNLIVMLALMHHFHNAARSDPASVQKVRIQNRPDQNTIGYTPERNIQTMPDRQAGFVSPGDYLENSVSSVHKTDKSADQVNQTTESLYKLNRIPIPKSPEKLTEASSTEQDTSLSDLVIRDVRSMNDETEVMFFDTNDTSKVGESCLRLEITGNDRLLPFDLLIHTSDSDGHPCHYYLDWDETHPNEYVLYAADLIMEGEIRVLYRQESIAEFDLIPCRQTESIVLEIEPALKYRESIFSYTNPAVN